MKLALALSCFLVASCATSQRATPTTIWADRYRESQIECAVGDPVLGLRRALEMPPRPNDDSLPLVSDLYSALDCRLRKQVDDLGMAIEETPMRVQAEGKTTRLITEMQEVLAKAKGNQDSDAFAARINSVAATLTERDKQRTTERGTHQASCSLADQDHLLGSARAHDKAGEYGRAIGLYRELIATDNTDKLAPLLAPEMKRVQDKLDAVTHAR